MVTKSVCVLNENILKWFSVGYLDMNLIWSVAAFYLSKYMAKIYPYLSKLMWSNLKHVTQTFALYCSIKSSLYKYSFVMIKRTLFIDKYCRGPYTLSKYEISILKYYEVCVVGARYFIAGITKNINFSFSKTSGLM